MEISCWYDDIKREEALKNLNDVLYYMIHASKVEERRHWAEEYTKMIESNGTNIRKPKRAA